MTNQISLSGASDVRPKLSALIKDMCPHGVEWKTIGETLGVNRGKRLTKSELSEDGSYEVYHGSKDTPLGCYTASNAPKDTVIVVNTGGIGGVKYLDKDFWCSDGSFWIGHSDIVNNKFLYYFLSRYEGYFESQKRVGGVPTIDRKVVEDFEIPIPPLEIQKKIVECLDKFSALAAELQAELQMRRKQYEYYRTQLLTPHSDCNSAGDSTDDCNWEWKTLGEIFELRGGYTPSKNNPDFWEGGTIPWFRMEDIRENGRILKDAILRITPNAVKGKGLFEKDSFVLATSATIGEHALLAVDALTNQRFTNLKVRKQYKDALHTKFIFYYMFKVDDFCKAHTNLSGFESVDMDALRKMPFPIPPLDEQKRIADLLDKFESLTTSLSDGIPAEQAAQQKRYEYYRDKLLTFPMAEK